MCIRDSAQTPQQFSYQAVVRDNSNNLVSNQTVGMQISILEGAPNGIAVYTETHTPVTNANGLVNVSIGLGTAVTGVFDSIDWSVGNYFIKTETDLAGGTNYTITGTSQLQSVPYALFAQTSATTSSSNSGSTNNSDCNCTNYIIPWMPYSVTSAQIIRVTNTPPEWNGNPPGSGTSSDIFAEAIDEHGNIFNMGYIDNISANTVKNISATLDAALQIYGFYGNHATISLTFSNPENIYVYAGYNANSNSRTTIPVQCVR